MATEGWSEQSLTYALKLVVIQKPLEIMMLN